MLEALRLVRVICLDFRVYLVHYKLVLVVYLVDGCVSSVDTGVGIEAISGRVFRSFSRDSECFALILTRCWWNLWNAVDL